MSKGKKIISKGYTLEVVSWENDGDNYKTKTYVVEDKDLAVNIAKMAQKIFVSSTNNQGGIGNTNEGDEDEAKEVILDYLETNNVFPDQDKMSDEEKVDKVMEINYSLMGGSEYYYSRVLESITLTYSPEDVYLDLEIIEF